MNLIKNFPGISHISQWRQAKLDQFIRSYDEPRSAMADLNNAAVKTVKRQLQNVSGLNCRALDEPNFYYDHRFLNEILP